LAQATGDARRLLDYLEPIYHRCGSITYGTSVPANQRPTLFSDITEQKQQFNKAESTSIIIVFLSPVIFGANEFIIRISVHRSKTDDALNPKNTVLQACLRAIKGPGCSSNREQHCS
jgi:hypothetical protein